MKLQVLCWPDPSTQGNPYLPALYDGVRASGVGVLAGHIKQLWRQRADVWHLHWPEHYLNARTTTTALLKTAYFLACVAVAKARGVKLVWTAHNLRSHEQYHPRLERVFWAVFTRQVDATIFMSQTSREMGTERHKALSRKPARVIPHGHYRGDYPMNVTRCEARDTLSVDASARVVLCFGQLRRYKNVPALVTAFRQVSDAYAGLVVAGACQDAALEQEIRDAAAGDARVRLDVGYVSHNDTPNYLRAADLMCLPYLDPLNSGAAILALSFGTPCLMSDAAASRELQQRVGAEWLRLYSGALTADVLGAALAWSRRARALPMPDLDWCDWRAVARATVDFYNELAGAAQEASSLRSGPDVATSMN